MRDWSRRFSIRGVNIGYDCRVVRCPKYACRACEEIVVQRCRAVEPLGEVLADLMRRTGAAGADLARYVLKCNSDIKGKADLAKPAVCLQGSHGCDERTCHG